MKYKFINIEDLQNLCLTQIEEINFFSQLEKEFESQRRSTIYKSLKEKQMLLKEIQRQSYKFSELIILVVKEEELEFDLNENITVAVNQYFPVQKKCSLISNIHVRQASFCLGDEPPDPEVDDVFFDEIERSSERKFQEGDESETIAEKGESNEVMKDEKANEEEKTEKKEEDELNRNASNFERIISERVKGEFEEVNSLEDLSKRRKEQTNQISVKKTSSIPSHVMLSVNERIYFRILKNEYRIFESKFKKQILKIQKSRRKKKRNALLNKMNAFQFFCEQGNIEDARKSFQEIQKIVIPAIPFNFAFPLRILTLIFVIILVFSFIQRSLFESEVLNK